MPLPGQLEHAESVRPPPLPPASAVSPDQADELGSIEGYGLISPSVHQPVERRLVPYHEESTTCTALCLKLVEIPFDLDSSALYHRLRISLPVRVDRLVASPLFTEGSDNREGATVPALPNGPGWQQGLTQTRADTTDAKTSAVLSTCCSVDDQHWAASITPPTRLSPCQNAQQFIPHRRDVFHGPPVPGYKQNLYPSKVHLRSPSFE